MQYKTNWSNSVFVKTSKQNSTYENNHFESQSINIESKLQKLKYQAAVDRLALFRQIKSCFEEINIPEINLPISLWQREKVS